ncbi:Ribosome biogenesis protein RPF2 [Wickerhamiella sorbophila]|uniref:Ribosome production factor 2 homolog n=1 Tax=Wickerhamiella sorbophila TaxID=45607 RepID=A0A2T0FFJ8_9ASCO|nr:Ribosome biogenesis protein RPF2 [Wickerhamiella sorbophila]PRT53772.1 Ribosome biogenesis protein RPF2 [Wickerhamiella sorbophila]
MLRTVKAKNARSKRAMDGRAPKVVENTKQALFVPGANSNKLLHDAMVDLCALKKPDGKRFQKKNDVRPFEDSSSLEFFSEKNDSSLLVFSSHNKKRPNTLTFARTFNYQIYDMVELSIVQAKLLQEFKKTTFHVGLKPMFTFNGEVFESHPTFIQIKSLFLDFFRGQESEALDPAALQHVISITAENVDDDSPSLPLVHFRVYLLKTYKSTTPKVPRVELEEIGPRFDFKVGRTQAANPDMEKQAMKRAKIEEKTKKNVETDIMGDKVGRIHMEKQDFGKLQTRKMKGLKRQFDQVSEEEDSGEEESGEDFGEFSD